MLGDNPRVTDRSMGAASNSDECPPLITNAGQSETRSWLNGLSENGGIKLWHDDDRAWVQWLMGLLRLTWRTLVSNHVNVMLVFVLVGKKISNLRFAGRFDFARKRFVRRVILSYVHEL